MKTYNLSVLILSCDKNYDLVHWINKTCDCFLQLGIECIVVTENEINDYDKRIHAYALRTTKFDERFVCGMKKCTCDNVLVLLDDYFVHDDCLNKKIPRWLGIMRDEELAALRISKINKLFIKKTKIKNKYYLLNSIKPYQIDFHPTIWNKNTLLQLIENRNFSPWTLEPCFALYLQNKRSCITKENIAYDELIIQGSFFKKPFNLYCKKEYSGSKTIINKKLFYKHLINTFVFNVSPYWLIRFLRRLFRIDSISAKAKL